MEHASSFIKKLLKKKCFCRNKVYKFNNIFIFRYLLNFSMRHIRGPVKALSSLFCTTYDAKSTKCREH